MLLLCPYTNQTQQKKKERYGLVFTQIYASFDCKQYKPKGPHKSPNPSPICVSLIPTIHLPPPFSLSIGNHLSEI